MRKLIILLLVLLPVIVLGQSVSEDENYVKSISYQTETQESEINSVSISDKISNVTYYDGLGRDKQSVAIRHGGSKENIIMHYEYDNVGRQTKSYMPYAVDNYVTSEGQINANSLSNTFQFYNTEKYENTTNPYSETVFEQSPISRNLEQAAPGSDWAKNSGHTIKSTSSLNTILDNVIDFDVIYENDDLLSPQLVYRGKFSKNILYKTIVKNENWLASDAPFQNTIEQYSDKFGRQILTRQFTESTDDNGDLMFIPVDTYGVYDDYGNLVYTISPKGVDNLLLGISYPDFNQNLSTFSVISTNGIGFTETVTGSTDISLNSGVLTLAFNTFNFDLPKQFVTGATVQLQEAVPDMYIGTLGEMGSEATGGFGYEFSVEDGFLVITGAGTMMPEDIVGAFTVALPEFEVQEDIINDLGYQYIYDYRNRLVKRKVSGSDWEYIVYDKLNRPVLTQDATLKEKGQWLFVKYDVFNRVVYNGLFTSTQTRAELQAIINNQTNNNETKTNTLTTLGDTSLFYSKDVFPNDTLNLEVLNIMYYDTYNFGLDNLLSAETSIYNEPITSKTKNLTLGSLTRVLNTNKWIKSVIQYDEKSRPVYTNSANDYLRTTDKVIIDYNFVGNVLKTEHNHHKHGEVCFGSGSIPICSPTSQRIITEDTFGYDHLNRMVRHSQEILDGFGNTLHPLELIERNVYDELGRVEKVFVGNNLSNALQEVNYTYNIRGWLKTINDPQANLVDDVFAMQINYNTITEKNNGNSKLNTQKLYNGNISEIISRTASDNVKRGYGYQYDNLHRLTKARYKAGENLNEEKKFFDLVKVKYDKNGNIKRLKRNAPNATFTEPELIDDIKYKYYNKSNLLKRTTDIALNEQGLKDGNINEAGNQRDYYYDSSGSLVEDKNKAIEQITYNYLNLPETITVTDQGTLNFVYTANGQKVEKIVIENGSIHKTAYAGKFIYEKQYTATTNNEPDYSLSFFSTSKGYVEPSASGYTYIYQYTDHQGNIRASYADLNNDGSIDFATEIVQAKNYYPFGLDHNYGANSAMSVINGTNHKWKFNGQEQEKALGINVTEMSWRQYDNALGRFHGVDKLSATEPHRTPYHFAGNNPIVFSDPSGLKRLAPNTSGGDEQAFVNNGNDFSRFNHYSNWEEFQSPLSRGGSWKKTGKNTPKNDARKARWAKRNGYNPSDVDIPYPDRFYDWIFVPDGNKANDYAALSEHVYSANLGDSTQGYEVTFTINNDGENGTGFRAALYKKGKKYVLAFAGTSDKNDWETNYNAIIKGDDEQYRNAIGFAESIAISVGAENLEFTGHSLGGGLASAAALYTGGKAITFNAAGLPSILKDNLGLPNDASNILAIITEGEIIHHLQSKFLKIQAEGNPLFLPANYLFNPFNITAISVFNLFLRTNNHMIGNLRKRL